MQSKCPGRGPARVHHRALARLFYVGLTHGSCLIRPHPRLVTHPQSPYINNMIAVLPGPNRMRLTMFNERFNVRHASGKVERWMLESIGEYRTVLRDTFKIAISDDDLHTALTNVERRGTRGPPHPFFA